MSEIFDLNNLDDLPEDVRKEVAPLGLRKDTEMLLSLFDIKNQLSIDEIVVGLMRKHGLKKKRSWVSSTIYNLKRREIIKESDGNKKFYEKVKV
jgi:hypothetical protein